MLYGIILIQPTAPMPLFGVLYQQAHGHVVTTVLLAMIAMLLTAVSYGRMARVYPDGGSAFLYVGRELHPALGYMCGWCLTLRLRPQPVDMHHLEQQGGKRVPARSALCGVGGVFCAALYSA